MLKVDIKNKVSEYAILLGALALPLAFTSATRDNFLIKNLALSTAVVFTLASLLIRGKNIVSLRSRLSVPVCLFVLSLFLSLVGTKNLSVSASALFEKLIFIAVYFLALLIPPPRREKIFGAALVSSFLAGIYGIVQYAGCDFVLWKSGFGGRISSSFGNPNFFSGYLVAVLPLSLSYCIFKGKKLYSIVNTLLLVLCLVLTGTRGSWIAFAFSLFVFLMLLAWTRFIPPIRTLLMTGIVIALFSSYVIGVQNSFTRRVKSIFNPAIDSVQERVFKWYTAEAMIREHPITGVGIGAVKVNYALYQVKAKNRMRILLRGTSESQIHNEYLQIWAEAGTLGLIGFLSIIAFFFINALKTLNKPESPVSKGVMIGIIASVAGVLFDSISNFPLHIVPTAFLFWSYLATVEATEAACMEKEKPGGGSMVGRICLVLLIVLVWVKFSVFEFAADLHRKRGDDATGERNWTKAIAEYGLAHKLSPIEGRICYDMGMAYVQMKDYDNAIKSFGESIKIRNYGEVYNDLANCYYMKNVKDAAIRNWDMAVRLGLPNPEDQDRVRKNLSIMRSK